MQLVRNFLEKGNYKGKGNAAYPSFFRRGTQLIWEIVVAECDVIIKGGWGKDYLRWRRWFYYKGKF